jgi:hypothetical protein
MVLMIKPEPEDHFECPGDFEIVVVQQLKRIADALDRAYPKPEPEFEIPHKPEDCFKCAKFHVRGGSIRRVHEPKAWSAELHPELAEALENVV